MMYKKEFLCILSDLDKKHVYMSNWFGSLVAAQHWAENYECGEDYFISVFQNESESPVVEYIISTLNG